jgi:hypothetical protein
VELIIVIVVIGIIFPVFSALFVNTYHDAYVADNKTKASTMILQALSYINEAAVSTNDFQTGISSPFTDAYGPNDLGSSGAQAWTYKGKSSTNRVLITQNYATTVNALNTGRQPVFENTAAFNCTTQMSYQPQLVYMTIFFVKNNTLYRRILTDTTTAVCAGNTQQQKQSCPPYIASGSLDATCKANDEILATNVTGFSVDYFQIASDGTSTQIDPTYASSDPTILTAADYINLTITASANSGGTTTTMTQRMTKVNQ